jgi:hypothetical protein
VDIRDVRLAKEFQRIQSLVGQYSLFDFFCADFTPQEAAEVLARRLTPEGLIQALPNYLEPGEYQRRYPDTPPGKYMIRYSCTGLLEPRAEGEEPRTSSSHMMTIMFGYDFPARPPILIWYTPIWHPNFHPPHVCTQGRPFSAGVSLNRIVLTVGEMIQYRNYNLADPLNIKARDWARQNIHLFPVDNRDLVDSRYRYKTQAGAESLKEEPLVELVGLSGERITTEDRLVEFTD